MYRKILNQKKLSGKKLINSLAVHSEYPESISTMEISMKNISSKLNYPTRVTIIYLFIWGKRMKQLEPSKSLIAVY